MLIYEFYYNTLQRLLSEGWDGVTPTPAAMRQAIIEASQRVNTITSQHFSPVLHAPIKFLSPGTDELRLPTNDKIIRVDRLLISGEELPADAYRHDAGDRFIWLRRELSHPSRIEFHGLSGWLENPKALATTTTAAIPGNVTEVGVANVEGFEPFDIILIGDKLKLTVTEVDLQNSKLKFDLIPTLPELIPAGTAVLSYGRVPAGIVDVTTSLINRAINKDLSADPNEQRIISERTDNYQYTLSDGAAQAAASAGSATGSLDLDAVLQEFCAPGVHFAP
jgi:hypothetical protein